MNQNNHWTGWKMVKTCENILCFIAAWLFFLVLSPTCKVHYSRSFRCDSRVSWPAAPEWRGEGILLQRSSKTKGFTCIERPTFPQYNDQLNSDHFFYNRMHERLLFAQTVDVSVWLLTSILYMQDIYIHFYIALLSCHFDACMLHEAKTDALWHQQLMPKQLISQYFAHAYGNLQPSWFHELRCHRDPNIQLQRQSHLEHLLRATALHHIGCGARGECMLPPTVCTHVADKFWRQRCAKWTSSQEVVWLPSWIIVHENLLRQVPKTSNQQFCGLRRHLP